MSGMESFLIIAGLSMEIFASMECQGALVAKINKRQLVGICLFVVAVQLAALGLGYFPVHLYVANHAIGDGAILGRIIAVTIFMGIGIHLIVEAVRNERIMEHLVEKIPMGETLGKLFFTSIYTILAGIAFGFLVTNVKTLLVMIGVVSAAFIVAGIYTGYHFGFEQKKKAYIIGGILLFLAGADVLVRLLGG